MSKHVINSLHLQQLNHKNEDETRIVTQFCVTWPSESTMLVVVLDYVSRRRPGRDVKLRRCRPHLGFKAKSCPI